MSDSLHVFQGLAIEVVGVKQSAPERAGSRSWVLGEWSESLHGQVHRVRVAVYPLLPAESPAGLMASRVRQGTPVPVVLTRVDAREAYAWTDGVDEIVSAFVDGSDGPVEVFVEISPSCGPEAARDLADRVLRVTRNA